VALACFLGGNAAAQTGGYSGPGILSRGAGNIGQRGGQQVDLRFFATATGVYDTGIIPVSVDSGGNLAEVPGLYGVEGQLGVYGTHSWRRSQLGLDYLGAYRHYNTNTYFNGSDHRLGLGYSHQASRRISFDMRALAGSLSRGIGGVAGYSLDPDAVFDPGAGILFDNRTNYLQGGMDMNILKSPRTMFTMGGDAYTVRRQSRALIGVNGYTLRGSFMRQITRPTSLGLAYQRMHFDFPRAFGESDIDLLHVQYARTLGRYWTLSLRGGVFRTEVQGLQRVSFDPAIAALLGVSSGVSTFYRKNWLPSAEASLMRTFRSATLAFQYGRTINPGNGIFLTSRRELGQVTFSYTGIRRWSFSSTAGYSALSGLGQDLRQYRQFRGGVGLNFAITRAVHLFARFDARHQVIDQSGFLRNGSRTTVGISFSPGDIPLSLW
jgi:hypothetical protein